MGGSVVGSGERLATGGYDNKIKLWDLPSGALLTECDVSVTPSTLKVDADGAVYVGGPDGYMVKLAAA